MSACPGVMLISAPLTHGKHLSLDNLHGHRVLGYSTRPQGSEMSQVKALPNIVEPGTIYPWRSREGSSSGVGRIVRGRVTSPIFLLLLQALFYQCDFIIFDNNLEKLLSCSQSLERKTLEKVRVLSPSLGAKSTTQLPGLSEDLKRHEKEVGESHPDVSMGDLLPSQRAWVHLTISYKTLNPYDLCWMVKSHSGLHFTNLPMVRGKMVPSLSGLVSSSHTLAAEVEEEREI